MYRLIEHSTKTKLTSNHFHNTSMQHITSGWLKYFKSKILLDFRNLIKNIFEVLINLCLYLLKDGPINLNHVIYDKFVPSTTLVILPKPSRISIYSTLKSDIFNKICFHSIWKFLLISYVLINSWSRKEFLFKNLH